MSPKRKPRSARPDSSSAALVAAEPWGLRRPYRLATAAILAALLAGLTTAAYLPALQGGFIWDDDDYVENNLHLRTAEGLRDIWCRYGATQQYYPLVHTTFWLEYQLGAHDGAGRPTPLSFHVVNVCLHVANALLLWAALKMLGLRGAYAAALLFAVHPVMVESAAWITERKNVLSMFFYLGALLAYLRFDRPDRRADLPVPPPRPWKFYALACLLFVCALLSKTVTFSLPVTIMLVLWWKGRHWTLLLTPLVLAPAGIFARLWASGGNLERLPPGATPIDFVLTLLGSAPFPWVHLLWAVPAQCGAIAMLWLLRRRIPWVESATLLPLLAVGGAMGSLTALMEKFHVGAHGLAWNLTFVEHVLLAGRIAWFYVGKLFWPHPIIFFYPRWTISQGVWWQYLYPLAAVAVLAGLWLARRRIGRGPLAAVLSFGVGVFPALGFVNVYPMRFSYVADHFQYLASLAIFALAIPAAERGIRALWERFHLRERMVRRLRWSGARPDLAPVLAGGALTLAAAGVLALLTWRQAHDYAGREALWTNTIAKNPASWISYNNLGCLYMVEANTVQSLRRSIPLYHEAIRLYAGGDANCAHDDPLLYARGDPNRLYDDAILNRGIVAARLLDYPAARRYFDVGFGLRPKDVPNRLFVGKMYFEANRHEDALRYFGECLAIDPNCATAHNNIGYVYEAQGRRGDAVAAYRRSLEIAPEYCDARTNLARLLRAESNELAIEQLRLSLRYDPNHVKSHEDLAAILFAERRYAESLAHARRALSLDANSSQSAAVAASVLASAPDDALRDGNEALRWALRCVQLLGDSHAGIVHMVAAAYAEAGQFDQAADIMERAAEVARQNGLRALAEDFDARLRLYRDRKPYRLPAAP